MIALQFVTHDAFLTILMMNEIESVPYGLLWTEK